MPWEGRECRQCGSVSILSLPSAKELETFYDTFNKKYDGGGGHLECYAKRYLREVLRLGRGRRLVDVGPSLSPFPNLARQAGFQVTAIDYIRPAGLREDIDFITGNLNNEKVLEELTEPFDIVCNFAVIEHCMYPDLACKILGSLCRPGGHIFLMTPEIGTFATTNALGRSGWFCPPMHLNLVSKEALVGLFDRHGVRLVSNLRLELNPLRWLARYGYGALEGCVGIMVKNASRCVWEKQRSCRVHRYKGMAMYLFEKTLDGRAKVAPY
jgi:2-polyprenyl-3-methyl-5-hydroxy-6-metoxy-1,4-benzoquinol methylase